MVIDGDFICSAYMFINFPYKPIRYLAYMTILMGIFVSGTYLAITCEVDNAVGFDLAYICKNVGSIFSFSIKAV